jgi:hypothetical protein
MNETCDRCGPSVEAMYRARRSGELFSAGTEHQPITEGQPVEYLITTTTHVPEEPQGQAVAGVRAREAAEVQAILRSLPLSLWMSVKITPYPGDLRVAAS